MSYANVIHSSHERGSGPSLSDVYTGGSSGMLPAYSSHRTHIEADVPTSPPSRKIRKDTFSCTSQAFTNE